MNTFSSLFFSAFFLFPFILTAAELPALTPVNPADLVRSADNREAVILRSSAGGDIPCPAGYVCRDYAGRTVLSGTAVPEPGGRLALPAPPASNGFYEYTVDGGQRIGVIVSPRAGTEHADRFFGMDCCFNEFKVFSDRPVFTAYMDILVHCGIAEIRDRLRWHRLQPSPDDPEIDFTLPFGPGAGLLDIHREAAARGIKILELFHDAPVWMHRPDYPLFADAGAYVYPTELDSAAASWKKIAAALAPYWRGLEVWNEPDIGFGNGMPGDQAASVRRAVLYGLAESGTKAEIVSGAFAAAAPSVSLLAGHCRNGAADHAGSLSFHYYGDPEGVEKQVRAYRAAVRDSRNPGLPLLVTEFGCPWKRGPGRASESDDTAAAVSIAAKTAEYRACGIAGVYLFVFAYYDEFDKNFGVMDLCHTPMRSLAAYAAAARLLGGLEYRGDLSVPVPGVKRARVFSDGVRAVVTLFTGTDKKARVELPAELRYRGRYGIDGRDLEACRAWDGDEQFWYLEGVAEEILPLVSGDTGAMRLKRVADEFTADPAPAKPAVIQHLIDTPETFWYRDGYLFRDPARAGFRLVFWNLGDAALTVAPEISAPAGAGDITGLPDGITLPPHSRAEYRLRADLSGVRLTGYAPAMLEIRDRDGNAEPLVLPLLGWKCAGEITAERGIITESDLDKDPELFMPLDQWSAEDGESTAGFRAGFKVFYSGDTLQFVITADGGDFDQPYPAVEMWRGNSAQIAWQFNRGAAFSEISAGTVAGEPAVFRHYDENLISGTPGGLCRASSVRTVRRPDGRRYYIINLDRAENGMPKLDPGGVLYASVLLNDYRGGVRRGWLHWGDGIGGEKNPGLFNLIKLR